MVGHRRSYNIQLCTVLAMVQSFCPNHGLPGQAEDMPETGNFRIEIVAQRADLLDYDMSQNNFVGWP